MQKQDSSIITVIFSVFCNYFWHATVSLNPCFYMSTFFTGTLTRDLPGLIDSNDTRADATWQQATWQQIKRDTRDIRTRYAALRGWKRAQAVREVNFCRSRETTKRPNAARTNISNKLPIQFSYAENIATSYLLTCQSLSFYVVRV